MNDGRAIEQAATYTIGLWQSTEAIPGTRKNGSNTLHFEIAAGSRGVTIKEFTLTPAKQTKQSPMKLILPLTALLLAPFTALQAAETPSERDARMQWWREARYGMFVHWATPVAKSWLPESWKIRHGAGKFFSREWKFSRLRPDRAFIMAHGHHLISDRGARFPGSPGPAHRAGGLP